MDRRALLGCTAFVVLGFPGRARAQTWPQRPIKFILTLGPGSATDTCARLVADRLSPIWGQPVVVENRPGGDGMVGISAFVAANDDHVLLFASSSIFLPHAFLREKLTYDAQRDLISVAAISEISVCVAVTQSLNISSLAELETLARRQPGKLNWGAIASIDDFMFSGFLKSAGLSMARVPYRDPVSALNDISEGRIDVVLAALTLALPRAQTGKVKMLAVTNRERSPTTPEVPTVTEAGYPSLTYEPILGLFAPPAMSRGIRERVAADLQTVAADPTIAARLAPTGQMIRYLPPVEFAASIEAERGKLAALAKALNIQPVQ
jgi:tripartite-type tricarboxylate transporter receptor subunit TctC